VLASGAAAWGFFSVDAAEDAYAHGAEALNLAGRQRPGPLFQAGQTPDAAPHGQHYATGNRRVTPHRSPFSVAFAMQTKSATTHP
jgi:hypothetical protein